MAKTCSSCGLVVNDAAHFCEKCGYQFASDPKTNVPAPSKNKSRVIGYIVLVIALPLIAFVIYYFRSATSTPPQGNISVQRAELVRRFQDLSNKALQDPGALVSDNGAVLTFESKTFAAGADFRSGFVREFQKRQNANLCFLGFRQVRLIYGGVNDDYPLECTDSPSAPQHPVAAEDRAKAVQELQGSWKDGVISAQGDLLRIEHKSLADPLVRANAWKMMRERNFLNAHHLCESGFRQIRLAYGDEGEDFSLGCGGSPPFEVKLL